MNEESNKSKGFVLMFKDDPELYEQINKYRINLGWTWRRLFLIGIANIITKNEDNPNLVLHIADYLEKRR